MQRTPSIQRSEPKQPNQRWAKDFNRSFTREAIRTEKKHTKRCSAAYVIREIHIKTTTRHHRMPVRTAKRRTPSTPNAGEDVEQQELSSPPAGMQHAQPLGKVVWRVPTKPNMLLPHDPAITLLCLYPKELKTYVPAKSCIWMFVAALFILAVTQEQPSGPSASEWINKTWSIQTRE